MSQKTTFKNRRLTSERQVIAFILLANLLLICSISWKASLYLPTNHLDGAFQTAAGLFKMKSGQIPGIDFFPYLGIGPLVLIYPFFLVFGQNLASTVFASYFITLLILSLTFIFSLTLITKIRLLSNRLILAFIPTLFVTPAVWIKVSEIGLTQYFGFESLLELSNPGNSLRPLRSFAAWLLPATIYGIYSRYDNRRIGHIAMGFFTGLIAILWSNDYGLVSSILGIFLYLIFVFRKSNNRGRDLTFWGLSLFSTVSILSSLILINGWSDSFFKYNFVDVRNDQFWYFGPWSITSRIFSFEDLFTQVIREQVLIPLLLLIFLFILSATRSSKKLLTMSFIGLGLFLGGCIATVGGHTSNYFTPFKLWAIYSTFALMISLIRFGIFQHKLIKNKNKKVGGGDGAIGIFDIYSPPYSYF